MPDYRGIRRDGIPGGERDDGEAFSSVASDGASGDGAA